MPLPLPLPPIHPTQVLPQLEALAKLYYHMFDAYEHIRLNHFHSDEVVKGLRLISSALCSCAEAPYLMLHMHGTRTLGMLLRCLSNIDEEVLASTPTPTPTLTLTLTLTLTPSPTLALTPDP